MPDVETQVGQDQDVIDFVAAKVRKMPGLACIGTVSVVGEVKDTKSELYMNARITIKGNAGSRSIATNFLFRPDWFIPGFDPESLNDIQEEDPNDGKPIGPKMYGQYRRYIRAQDGAQEPALLRGLCGSEEGYKNFLRKWNALYKSVVAERGAQDSEGNQTTLTPEEIRDLLNEFFTKDNENVVIGYELKQGQERAGENEDGKAVYRDTDRYELAVVRWYDETTLKGWERRALSAAKTAEKAGPNAVPSFKIGFSQE